MSSYLLPNNRSWYYEQPLYHTVYVIINTGVKLLLQLMLCNVADTMHYFLYLHLLSIFIYCVCYPAIAAKSNKPLL